MRLGISISSVEGLCGKVQCLVLKLGLALGQGNIRSHCKHEAKQTRRHDVADRLRRVEKEKQYPPREAQC